MAAQSVLTLEKKTREWRCRPAGGEGDAVRLCGVCGGRWGRQGHMGAVRCRLHPLAHGGAGALSAGVREGAGRSLGGCECHRTLSSEFHLPPPAPRARSMRGGELFDTIVRKGNFSEADGIVTTIKLISAVKCAPGGRGGGGARSISLAKYTLLGIGRGENGVRTTFRGGWNRNHTQNPSRLKAWVLGVCGGGWGKVVTPLANGATEIRHFVLFWEMFSIFR
jgi:hypothetical protein